jgi:hypothetical protein
LSDSGQALNCLIDSNFQELNFRTHVVVYVHLLGAVAQILWLIVFGVDERRWMEQASAAGKGA